jgi:hypothetical protein
MTDVFLHIVKVDEVGVVGAEKMTVVKQFLVFFEILGDEYLSFIGEVKPAIATIGFYTDNILCI